MKVQGIEQVRFEQVVKVYSGKPGCMCGCKGDYRYRVGAEKPDYGKFGDRQVRRVLNVLQQNATVVRTDSDEKGVVLYYFDDFSQSETGRTYCLWADAAPEIPAETANVFEALVAANIGER